MQYLFSALNTGAISSNLHIADVSKSVCVLLEIYLQHVPIFYMQSCHFLACGIMPVPNTVVLVLKCIQKIHLGYMHEFM